MSYTSVQMAGGISLLCGCWWGAHVWNQRSSNLERTTVVEQSSFDNWANRRRSRYLAALSQSLKMGA